MALALFILSPFVFLVTLGLSAVAKARMPSVSGFVWMGLIGSLIMALLGSGLTLGAIGQGSQFQKRWTGRVHAGPLQLVAYQMSGFQDPAEEWLYRPGSRTLAELRKHCRPLEGNRCSIYDRSAGRASEFVWIEGDELVVGYWDT